LSEKIYDSENDLSEQMILLLAREIGFIQESENGNRAGLPFMIRWFTVSIPFRTIWQCSTNQLFCSIGGSRPMQLEEISED
jgi:hypothetical protein